MAGATGDEGVTRAGLAGQMSYALVTRVAPKAASALLFITLLRQSGAAAAGALSLAMAFFTVTLLLSSLGLDELVVREVARRPASARVYLVNSIAIRLVSAAAFYSVLAALVVKVMGYDPGTQRVILIQCLAIFPESITAAISAIWNGQRLLRSMAIIAVLTSLCQAGVVGLVLWSGMAVEVVVWMLVAISVLGAMLSLAMTARFEPSATTVDSGPAAIPMSARASLVDVAFCKGLLRQSGPFAVVIALVSVDAQVDVVFLSAFGSLTDVGTYSAARTIILALSLIPQSFRMAMYPELVKAHAMGREALLRVYRSSWRYLSGAAWPICTGLALAAPGIVAGVYGAQREGIAVPLVILSLHLLVGFLYISATRLLLVAGLQSWLAVWAGIGLAANLLACALLVPAWQATGTAIARSVASLIYFALVEAHVQIRVLPASGGFATGARAMIASAVMALALLPVRDQSWFVVVPLGVVVYGLARAALERAGRPTV